MKMSGRVAASAINNREVINGKKRGGGIESGAEKRHIPSLTTSKAYSHINVLPLRLETPSELSRLEMIKSNSGPPKLINRKVAIVRKDKMNKEYFILVLKRILSRLKVHEQKQQESQNGCSAGR